MKCDYDSNGGIVAEAHHSRRFREMRQCLESKIRENAKVVMFDVNSDEFELQKTRHRSLTSVLYRIANCSMQVRQGHGFGATLR
jgi:hypothetical protein